MVTQDCELKSLYYDTFIVNFHQDNRFCHAKDARLNQSVSVLFEGSHTCVCIAPVVFDC